MPSHPPPLFLGFIKQPSSAMDAEALHLKIFLPQDGLWNAVSPPGWKQPWEKGRRAGWKLHPFFLPPKPAGCRCQSGIKSSKLGNEKSTNGNVTLKNHSGEQPQLVTQGYDTE